MCGIVGFIGKENIKEHLIDLLEKVEYRGYDSAGMAYVRDNNIVVNKSVGAVSNLRKYVTDDISNTCGIAHTRWATHGKANITNAHPHSSEDENWAIVHNGIIENYLTIKKELISTHHIKYISETDTEAIAHLLQLSHKTGLESLKFACDKLSGSYAIAIIEKSNPQQILVARKESPLYVAYGKDGNYVASDPICFVDKCEEYYTLQNFEFARVSANCIEIYDNNLVLIDRMPTKLNLTHRDSKLGEYSHYMQKEISQEKDVIESVLNIYSQDNIFKRLDTSNLLNVKKIVLIGCGTAYHAGLMGAKFIEKYSKISASGYIASEFRYSDTIIDSDTIAIFVSQSGETADTLGALEIAKSKGIKTIALTNVLYSTLAQNVDAIFPVCAGPELAVVSTKAYTSQIAILYLFAKYLEKIKFHKENNSYSILQDFLNTKEDYFQKIDQLSNDLQEASNVFFIGRDIDYITTEEASLKLKEITYINSSAYPSGELKHGFLALVDSNTIVFVLATQKGLLDKTLNSANEILSRGGKIVMVSNLAISDEKLENVYMHINLSSANEEASPLISIKFFQWLAYFTSIKKGLNPDKPRNLAKSVTVE